MSASKRSRWENEDQSMEQSDLKENPAAELKESFAQTSFESQRVKFSWKVTDWRMGLPHFESNSLTSPFFESSDYKWTLRLVICSAPTLGMQVFLRLEECPEKFVMVLGNLGIEGIKPMKIGGITSPRKSSKLRSLLQESNQEDPKATCVPPTLSQMVATLGTAVIPTKEMGSEITVFADFQFSVNRVREMTNVGVAGLQSSARNVEDSRHQKDVLCKALGSLLFDGRERDMSISVKGTHVPAHRAILAARSPVFKTMIDEADSKQSTLQFEFDCDNIRAWNEFQTFIYTGEMSVNAQELLDMGDALFILQKKFEIESFSDHLTSRLVSILSCETVLDVLEIAFKHEVTPLIMEATKDLQRHLSKLKKERRLELISFVQRHAEVAALLVDVGT